MRPQYMEPLALTHPPRPGEAARDVRYTPAWCTELLLERVRVPQGTILDPCAGDGAILRVLRDHGYSVESVEIREEEAEGLAKLGTVLVGDWCKLSVSLQAQAVLSQWPPVIVTNPPYSIGAEFMGACLAMRPVFCAALLRLNHLGSGSWRNFWQRRPPTGLLIMGSRRPSFTGDGKTDASEYVWVVWDRLSHCQWTEVV